MYKQRRHGFASRMRERQDFKKKKAFFFFIPPWTSNVYALLCAWLLFIIVIVHKKVKGNLPTNILF